MAHEGIKTALTQPFPYLLLPMVQEGAGTHHQALLRPDDASDLAFLHQDPHECNGLDGFTKAHHVCQNCSEDVVAMDLRNTVVEEFHAMDLMLLKF